MFLHRHTVCVCIHNYWKRAYLDICSFAWFWKEGATSFFFTSWWFFNSPGKDITKDGGIGLIGTFSKVMWQAVCASPCLNVKGERGCVLFNTCFAEMANDNFFSRLIPPFYDKCRTMQEKDHHLPGLLRLVENFFKYSQKFTIKVSLSLLSLLTKT